MWVGIAVAGAEEVEGGEEAGAVEGWVGGEGVESQDYTSCGITDAYALES